MNLVIHVFLRIYRVSGKPPSIRDMMNIPMEEDSFNVSFHEENMNSIHLPENTLQPPEEAEIVLKNPLSNQPESIQWDLEEEKVPVHKPKKAS